MLPLDKDLQKKKTSLKEFSEIALRVLNYLPNVLSTVEEKGDYKIFSSVTAGTTKYLRPINKKIFIDDAGKFIDSIRDFDLLVEKIKNNERNFSLFEKHLIDSYLYTIQQLIGAGLDLLVDPNSGRKHAGNRFEELIKAVFTAIGIFNKRIIYKIPYETDEGKKLHL